MEDVKFVNKMRELKATHGRQCRTYMPAWWNGIVNGGDVGMERERWMLRACLRDRQNWMKGISLC